MQEVEYVLDQVDVLVLFISQETKRLLDLGVFLILLLLAIEFFGFDFDVLCLLPSREDVPTEFELLFLGGQFLKNRFGGIQDLCPLGAHFGGFADFTMLGVDADGVYVSANIFDSRAGQSLTGASVFSIPKADLLSSSPSIARMTPFENLDLIQRGFTIQPVNDFGPSKGHGSLIAVDAIQLGKIDRTNIIGPAFANAALSPTTVIAAADESLPPLGRQPDGTQRLDFGNDNYLASVYQVGDSIWAVHGTDVNNHAAIRWTVLDEKTHAIIQEGTIADGRYDFLYPSIAGNQFGEAVIGYTRTGSGPTDFPSAFASIGTAADGVTTFGDPVLLQAGLANYHKFNSPLSPERWGDYSQTSIDPDNPHIFWTTQEFSMTVDRWGTQITQIIVPEPATAGLVLLASTLLLCWRRRA